MLIHTIAKQIKSRSGKAVGARLHHCATKAGCSATKKRVLGCCALVAAFSQITACDAFSSDTRSEAEIVVQPQVIRGTDVNTYSASGDGSLLDGNATAGHAFRTSMQLVDGKQARIAVSGSDEIPYPIYPEAKQYRVGGENGLHVVIFETNDSFEEVDTFYKNYVGSQGYARLVGMSDYVRYDTSREAAVSNTSDAWRNDRPGIVIHGFTNSEEAKKSGADAAAKTNIIVSY